MIPSPPPRPLTRYYRQGLFDWPWIPRWMQFEDFYKAGEVAVSLDGTKTYPKKLSPDQQKEVDRVRDVIAYYQR